MQYRDLIYPMWFKGIGLNHKGVQNMKILGLDTETVNGKPMTIQLASRDTVEIIFVNEKNVTEKFVELIRKYVTTKFRTAVFCHNYKDFDLGILFFPYWEQLANDEGFEIKGRGWKLKGRVTGTPFAELSMGKNRTVIFYDSMSFFQMGLDRLAKSMNVGEKKPKPKLLGKKKYTHKDKKFIDYAVNDAVIQHGVGEQIFKYHEKYDVQMSLSIAQLAERIFRHQFLNKPWPSLPDYLNYFCLRSYHGGKNGMYVKPGMYKNVNYYDIKSAYPWAMYQLPDFDDESGSWYEVKELVKEHFGIYKITGTIKDCLYPVCFTDNFKKQVGKGEVYLTSPEVFSALKHKELKIDHIEGLIFAEKNRMEIMFNNEKDTEKTSFQKFIDHFYELKNQTPKEDPNYIFYKIILNSLYGKFIQMVKVSGDVFDLDNYKHVGKKYKVGQMFNPFIASLITGLVRAKMHDLEHKYKALHVATDSIMTKEVIKKELGENLGDLALEFSGDALLLRNKLYVLFDKKKEIKKYALHGFHSNIEKLMELYNRKGHEYTYNHMTKIKESIKQKIHPFQMIQKKANLHLDL